MKQAAYDKRLTIVQTRELVHGEIKPIAGEIWIATKVAHKDSRPGSTIERYGRTIAECG